MTQAYRKFEFDKAVGQCGDFLPIFPETAARGLRDLDVTDKLHKTIKLHDPEPEHNPYFLTI